MLSFLLLRPSGVYLERGCQPNPVRKVCPTKFVLQKLLDQVNVGHDHATAAVALAAELIKGLSIGEPSVLNQDNELFPKVTHDLAT